VNSGEFYLLEARNPTIVRGHGGGIVGLRAKRREISRDRALLNSILS